MKKRCSNCGEEKELEEFYKSLRGKMGRTAFCKKCHNQRTKKWRDDNPGKTKEYQKRYTERVKRWHQKNREQSNLRKKEWAQRNKKKVYEHQRVHAFERRKNDPLYRYRINARCMVHNAVYKDREYSKSTKTAKVIGCSQESLRKHLCGTWKERYGKVWNGEKFHIDHIVPISSAKNFQEIDNLCHYTNLQMLTPEDNIRKGSEKNFT